MLSLARAWLDNYKNASHGTHVAQYLIPSTCNNQMACNLDHLALRPSRKDICSVAHWCQLLHSSPRVCTYTAGVWLQVWWEVCIDIIACPGYLARGYLLSRMVHHSYSSVAAYASHYDVNQPHSPLRHAV